MSRKMIDYKVENGKITSIDGYNVGGGEELTGESLMNATKDSTTITRTLDTDGKVKLDAVGGGGGTNVQELLFKVNVSTGDMNVGDVKSFRSNNIMIDTTNTTTLCYVPFYFSTVDTPYDTNTATTLTITEYIGEDNGKANMKISIICLKAGKYTANLTFAAKRLYTNK